MKRKGLGKMLQWESYSVISTTQGRQALNCCGQLG